MPSTHTTRQNILHTAYGHIQRYGYQGMRPAKVIAELGLTKGAFYYHFKKGKHELGLAVVDELIGPNYMELWQMPEGFRGNALDHLIRVVDRLSGMCTSATVHLGCPLNNLVQEMATTDESFRRRLAQIVEGMTEAVRQCLEYGRRNGQIRPDIDPAAVARMMIATVEGAFGMAKAGYDTAFFQSTLTQLKAYLRSLSR